MAGTKRAVEELRYLRANTALTADSTALLSMSGIDVSVLVDRSLCFAEAEGSLYRWFADSTLTPSGDEVIIPDDQDVAVAGRWIKQARRRPRRWNLPRLSAGFADETGAQTQALDAQNWTSIVPAAWGISGGNSLLFSEASSGVYQFDGATGTVVSIRGYLTFRTNAGSELISVGIGLGQPTVDEPQEGLAAAIAPAADFVNVAVERIATLTNGDLISLRARNETNAGGTLQMGYATLAASAIG